MKKVLLCIIFLSIVVGLAEATEVDQRATDKEIIKRLTRIEERLTRVEEGQKYILREMDKRFEAVDKRFEAIEREISHLVNLLVCIVLAFAGIVSVTIGFAIWDRKTALRPAIVKTTKLEEEFQRIMQVLKEVAKKDINVAQALKYVGLV
ncbi:MAG: hypothetical protein AB1567_05960 [bacterium]